MTMPLAVEWTNLHQILRSLYADMLPLCSDMMGIAKGLAGLGALFFIAYRVWKSLAAAEPIDRRSIWRNTRHRRMNCSVR